MSRLEQIIAEKRRAVDAAKRLRPIAELERSAAFDKPARSLLAALQSSPRIGLIAEFKRKSPSRGWFKPVDFPAEPVVREYENAGAVAASILTDELFFGGKLEDLSLVSTQTSLPLLRKDFIIDAWQLAEARAAGADLVLLIAACLAVEQASELARYAKSIGLETLLEIHGEDELRYLGNDIDLVGVNNRDLKTFEVNLDTSFRLAERVAGKPAVAESGIQDPATVLGLEQAGYRACLIGEQFMREADPGEAFRNFAQQLRQQSITKQV